jgi:xanthine phosphoribosyltransferase
MKELKEKILNEASVLPGGLLRVDSFLNHQIDVKLVSECGKKWYELFKDAGITKILTIESAGIGIAALTAQYFGVPVVYAKKTRSAAIGNDFYSAKVVSYTHAQVYEIIVSKKYINENDKVLIIDDFLAGGSAIKVLINLAEMGGAKIAGAGVVIEKSYEKGGKDLRDMGYRIESLAKISSIGSDGKITFAE